VADRFCQPLDERPAIRQRLGGPENLPGVLMVGGGEGMGPLEQMAEAIDRDRLPVALAVIAGRNQALKARLERRKWCVPTRVYGFVTEMPAFMRAAISW
jgi:1,2-diacylglycerol 3-beta-galactosyltransferase